MSLSRLSQDGKHSSKLKSNRRKIRLLAGVFAIAFVALTARYFGLRSFLSPTALRERVLSYGPLAPLAFVIVYSIATIFFLPGTPVTIAGGVIFGKFLGTIYTIIGATLGATIAFIAARALGESFVEDLLKKKYKKLYEYDKKIQRNGLAVVLFLRFVPLFPFNGLNFALGLTKVKTRDFILGTAVGIIPGSFALAFIGDSVATFSPFNLALSISLFALLALTPYFYKKYKSWKRNGRR